MFVRIKHQLKPRHFNLNTLTCYFQKIRDDNFEFLDDSRMHDVGARHEEGFVDLLGGEREINELEFA